MREITVTAEVGQAGRVAAFVNRMLAELDCPEQVRIQVDVAVDEIFSNIARYAYGPTPGEVTVRTEAETAPREVRVTFIDRGRPFDPLTAAPPDISLPAGERPLGGLGLFMVRQTMDGVDYSRRGDRNILTIRKRL